MQKILVTGLAGIVLSGCVTNQPDMTPLPQQQVITKTIKQKLPHTQVAATFGYANDPLVAKAYQRYVRTGHMQSIKSSGFRTVAFNQHHRTLIGCSPLHLCVVQLEAGEQINNIELGDSARWLVNTSFVGTKDEGSQQISIKPKQVDIATDMIVSTNKRTYHLGLVSEKGKSSEVVSFYYPEQTLAIAVASAKLLQQSQSHTIDSSPQLSLNQLNFNYQVRGSKSILPSRVFDDGRKTYIEMPASNSQRELPVLYLKQSGTIALVNYRFQKPYFIVDNLFHEAFLVAGQGKRQQRVNITNRKMR
jgi:type IV secretion system protein TrbG